MTILCYNPSHAQVTWKKRTPKPCHIVTDPDLRARVWLPPGDWLLHVTLSVNQRAIPLNFVVKCAYHEKLVSVSLMNHSKLCSFMVVWVTLSTGCIKLISTSSTKNIHREGLEWTKRSNSPIRESFHSDKWRCLIKFHTLKSNGPCVVSLLSSSSSTTFP